MRDLRLPLTRQCREREKEAAKPRPRICTATQTGLTIKSWKFGMPAVSEYGMDVIMMKLAIAWTFEAQRIVCWMVLNWMY